MEEKPEDYRRYAAEAEERAEQVRDSEAKRACRDIAKHWRALADQADLNRL